MGFTDEQIQHLIDKAKQNKGIKTDAEKQREDAVRFLAGKPPREKPLRPEVRFLLGRD